MLTLSPVLKAALPLELSYSELTALQMKLGVVSESETGTGGFAADGVGEMSD